MILAIQQCKALFDIVAWDCNRYCRMGLRAWTMQGGRTMPYVIVALWRARDGEAEELAKLLPELVRACKSEPGVIEFIAHRSRNDPNEFLLYEQYRDEAAFKEHQQTAHFRTLVLDRAVPRLANRERLPFQIIQ